eukprot:gene37307-45294_t
MSVQATYVSSDTVVGLIKRGKVAKDGITGTRDQDTIIVDVRDDEEFEYGHIVGAKHLPSEYWQDNRFICDFLASSAKYDNLIFHCQMSQVRGPTCARRCAEVLSESVEQGLLDAANVPKVLILKGGFQQFGARHKDDPELVASG